MGFLRGQLTHALACRHCGSSTCLQSPGDLVILFLFMVWQIRRWWHLGSWQYLQPWYSGDIMKGKGRILNHLAFLDHLWKQKSEEEEGEEEEEESSFLDPLKPCSSNEAPAGKQGITALPQPSCGSEGFYKATRTPEKILTQPSSPSRSLPNIQILTNLPVRNKMAASGGFLKQKRSQLFWGLPSLHSESLETIFLSSHGSSPLRLSACPSVFFNKVPFLPMYNLLLSHYHSPTHYLTPEEHTMDGWEERATGPELVSSLSFRPVPSLSYLKPLPVDHEGIFSGAESHTQWPSQHREVPLIPEDQDLHLQPELQRIRCTNLLSSSEAWRAMPLDPHQHKPKSPSASLPYPSSPLGVLTSSEAPWRTMRKNEHLKASKSTIPTPSPILASLPELQRVNPTGDLSGYNALWETTVQKENPQICKSPIFALCQPRVPMTEAQETGSPGIRTGYEAQWGVIGHKESPKASKLLMPASCQHSASLSELQKGGLSTCKDFWKTIEYRQDPQVAKFPMPASCLPLVSLSELQKKSPLEDLSGYESQLECQENSGKLWDPKIPALDFNTGPHETSSACVSPGSETQKKGRQSRKNLFFTDPVSSPNLFSESLSESAVMGLKRSLSEPKTLWESKKQREDLWVSDSADFVHKTPLVPFIEQKRIDTVDGFPRSEATQKDIVHPRNSWVSEPSSPALSPSLALALEPFRVSPILGLFNSEARFGNSWASELPVESLPQYLHGASPVGGISESVGGNMKQKETGCDPVSPIWGPRPPLNSVSKFHMTEPARDQCNCKPMGEAVEQRKDLRATELSAPSSLAFPSQEPHSDLEFVCRNVQEKEAPKCPSPPAVNVPYPTSLSLYLAKFPTCKPTQPGLQKEMFSEAKAEASSSEPVSEVLTHPHIHAWQWSEELKLKLKKLQQSPAFKSPDTRQSLCSISTPNSTSPDSQGLSSCPFQNHPPGLHPYSSSSHPKKVHSTAPQSVQAPHNFHLSSQPQVGASGRAEQEYKTKERRKGKRVAQDPSPVYVYGEAGEKCSGLGEPSNVGVLASGKRQNKALVILPLAQKRVSPRKLKAGECGRGNARLDSPTAPGKSHHVKASRAPGAPLSRFSERSHYRGQSSPHTALPQQFLPKEVGSQDGQRVALVTGHIQNPHHGKHCPRAHVEKNLPSSTPQVPLTRRFQRILAKFLGTHGPLPIKSGQ